MQDDESKAFHLGLLKLALLRFEVKLVLVEVFQNPVLLQGLCKDEDVIKVHTHHYFYNEVMEDVIHHGLEYSRAISEAKEHD